MSSNHVRSEPSIFPDEMKNDKPLNPFVALWCSVSFDIRLRVPGLDSPSMLDHANATYSKQNDISLLLKVPHPFQHETN